MWGLFRRRPMRFDPNTIIIRDKSKATLSDLLNDIAEDLAIGTFGRIDSMVVILGNETGFRTIHRGLATHGDLIRALAYAQLECVNESEEAE